jgi:hypothetical protein
MTSGFSPCGMFFEPFDPTMAISRSLFRPCARSSGPATEIVTADQLELP